MHLSTHARIAPDRPALIMAASGEAISYRELEQRSNQGAQLFRQLGLARGDVIAILLENSPRYFELAWAAQRTGLYYTCISSKLTADEAEYIIRDCGARLLVTSREFGELAVDLKRRLTGLPIYMVVEPLRAFLDFEAEREAQPVEPVADESAGSDMLYTSGTTGRPKGVKPPLGDQPLDEETRLEGVCRRMFAFEAGCNYLCPAPLYHSAPLRFSMTVQRLGGTVVLMERYDAEAALELIERYRIACAQFVPTHFNRMLKLPEEARKRSDMSSLRSVVHASAPCPVPVKEAMIDWWGPIVHEYYSGTEGNGMCCISSPKWLAHKGSVGKSIVGTLYICDDSGEPLPVRAEGLV
ncbi:AMP-binding protein [Sphingopyxis sp. USTB-05]|uniref:AMP-binding protein n=1 Tax=Sphingopyxis sp. USTB-05 TaxID=2830667 RepID=UPI0034A5574D